ncbi:MAG: hypothetical protein ACPG8W_18275 [Candidatus Promineifilaceae bacterium]
MQNSKLIALLIAVVAAALVLAGILGITRLYQGDGTLLRNASVTNDRISPNADGLADATSISYELSRNATVSIYFEDETGKRFYFRKKKERGVDQYAILFSGVVDGYALPDDVTENLIIDRLLQNGTYQWTITATDAQGVTETATGQLVIEDGDIALPLMNGFELFPRTFTPNRDGINDRVTIQFDLQKEVASLRVFLLTADGVVFPIQELPRGVKPNLAGRHVFDYEGGVDNGATPPPDGTYEIVAIAEDAEGQKTRVSSELSIEFGGVPRAEIKSPPIGDTIQFDATAIALCDTLHFTATVENYSETPIRTTGPEPGTVYDSDWNYNTLGWNTESGAFRFAIGYENETSNYAYRWAVGDRDSLTKIGDFYYLMPGQQVVITGGIRIVGDLGVRNPQPVWAGLIHEDVQISQFNNRVGAKGITLDLPADYESIDCGERPVPQR